LLDGDDGSLRDSSRAQPRIQLGRVLVVPSI
jgi:hypothetical protein